LPVPAQFESISVGDSESLVRRITSADVRKFADLSGDVNPLHLDRDFAQQTAFQDVVVHGMLGVSFISTVIGTKLPGPGALWLSQNLEFRKPVRLGDELTIRCTVLRKHERERLLDMETSITNQHGDVVVAGEGRVKMLRVAAPQEAPASPEPRVALVTGAAGGIGSAICRRISRAGLAIAIHCHRNQEQADQLAAEIQAAGGRSCVVSADLSREEEVISLYHGVKAALGRVDVLVNNASPPIRPHPLSGIAWADCQRHLDVQVRASLMLAQQCIPDMIARGWGRIVNISSQVADAAPTPGWSAYAMAKAALTMLARGLAAELGPHGITVNSVSPGMTATAMIGDIPEKLQMITARQLPLRRLAAPADIASAVAYLVSDEAAYVTGQTLRINGGGLML
jgi:3-oxoacyl-[acyl-carrier protein] reductase